MDHIIAALSCLLLYSFWVGLEHSLTIWLIFLLISPHILQEGESTLLCVVFDVACSYCLFFCRAYQGLIWHVQITFSHPESVLFFVCVFFHISNKLFIHLFLFPVFHPFLIQRFFKVFLWDCLSELQNPDILNTLEQIFIRILQIPCKINIKSIIMEPHIAKKEVEANYHSEKYLN